MHGSKAPSGTQGRFPQFFRISLVISSYLFSSPAWQLCTQASHTECPHTDDRVALCLFCFEGQEKNLKIPRRLPLHIHTLSMSRTSSCLINKGVEIIPFGLMRLIRAFASPAGQGKARLPRMTTVRLLWLKSRRRDADTQETMLIISGEIRRHRGELDPLY